MKNLFFMFCYSTKVHKTYRKYFTKKFFEEYSDWVEEHLAEKQPPL